MFTLKTPEILASEIAEFLNLKLIGNDFIVKFPATVNNFTDNSFFYIESEELPLNRLYEHKDVLILSSEELASKNKNFSFLISKNPKIDFIRVINEFFTEIHPAQIAQSAKIHSTVKLGRNISIGEYTIIGPNVSIGDNTRIMNNVVITGQTEIGNNCIIKDNSTIGSYGYNFVIDEQGIPIQYPNIGKIIIGNNVWLGANTSIECNLFEHTSIGDFVKIDDLVQIGYNTIIEPKCMITAGVIISHSVKVGENTLIAPNATIRENIKIGKNVTVGLGAVVVKDLKENAVYVGNPAHLLRTKK